MLGAVACGIPFSNHNYGTKNIIKYCKKYRVKNFTIFSKKPKIDLLTIDRL